MAGVAAGVDPAAAAEETRLLFQAAGSEASDYELKSQKIKGSVSHFRSLPVFAQCGRSRCDPSVMDFGATFALSADQHTKLMKVLEPPQASLKALMESSMGLRVLLAPMHDKWVAPTQEVLASRRLVGGGLRLRASCFRVSCVRA